MRFTQYDKLRIDAINRFSESKLFPNQVDIGNIWSKGWHDSKEDLLKRLIDSEYVIIDPNKIRELKDKIVYPCKNCKHETTMMKIGCTLGKRLCKEWQEYCWYRDLYDWFINREIPEPI